MRGKAFEIRHSTFDIQYCDVVVVGAGPAGCVAATRFARQGLHVVLADKSAGPPRKVCGEFLSPGCLPILDRIGALKFIREIGARPLRGMLIHTTGGQVLRANYPAPYHGLSIRRDLLDPILLDVAIKSGVEFLSNFQVSDLVWKGNRVSGVRGRHSGHPAALHARLVVGADGRNSVVARRLGAVRRHRWLDKVALVGYVAGARCADDVGEIFLGRDRYCILNPITPELTNIGLVLNRREFQPTPALTHFLLHAARALPGLGDRLARARPLAPARCLGPLAYSATRLTAPGALLIGDAAGFLDPFTGEGIYAALRSAEVAVESAIPSLLKNSDGAPQFPGFGEAWTRELHAKWRLCTALQYAIRRPWLAQLMVACLTRVPSLSSRLMAAVGDLIPAGDLTPSRLLAWMPPAKRSGVPGPITFEGEAGMSG